MVLKRHIYQGLKIKAATVIDFDDFYKKMWKWFNTNSYSPKETEYREIDSGGGAKHLEIRWESNKGIDSYVSFVVTVDFLILGFKDVEVDRNGIKSTLQKATYEMRFSSYLEMGKDEKFSGPVMSVIRNIYDRYIIRGRMEAYKKLLKEESDDFIGEVKSFFALHGATF